MRRFNKLSLAMSMRGSLKRLPETELPPEIRDLFDRWFCRVLADFKRQPDSYYSLGNRDFICDLSVCCLVTIPVGGAWGVHVSRAGVGPLRRGFPLQTMSYLGQLLGQTRGWSPFCVVHTFGRYVLRISPEALEGAYARTAELMKRNPRIKGIYRRSWMLDPALAGISPHLSYMREVPQRHGARFFRCPAGETDIRGALTGSAFRSRLYEEGKYRPTVYAFVWPRASVLEWAHTRRDKGDLSGSGYDSRSDDRGHMTRGATEAGNGGITPGVEKLET
ncbi:MAG: hypothetical protein M1550_04320 [Deltaproteobacteria bacterium]|nr:hypothetical protein [Deltaproteobacteria bacterium]